MATEDARDAARYRWLRSGASRRQYQGADTGRIELNAVVALGLVVTLSGEDLDSFVDGKICEYENQDYTG